MTHGARPYRLRTRITTLFVLASLCTSMMILCDSMLPHHDHAASVVPGESHNRSDDADHGACGHDGGCSLPCWYCGCSNTIVMTTTADPDITAILPSIDIPEQISPSPTGPSFPPLLQPPK